MSAPDLTPDEAAVVARFDAAMDAEESLRERVAAALWLTEGAGRIEWSETNTWWRTKYRILADAAIAVIRGDDA